MTAQSSTEVWSVLNRNLFFVRNEVKRLEAKSSDKFDVYDPASRELLFECREPNLGTVTKMRRLAGGQYDINSPFDLVATVPQSGQQVLRVARQIPFLSIRTPPTNFFDHENQQISMMKKKFFSPFTRKFQFFSPEKRLQLELSAKSILELTLNTRASYRLVAGKKELAVVSSNWKGPAADFFKQGFRLAVSIAEDVPQNSPVRQLLLAFGISVDRILKK